MEKKLAVGQLLSVPFGRRKAQGFLMALKGGAEGAPVAPGTDGSGGTPVARAYELKSVEAIVDEVPFFSPQLLELVKRIARYTISPLESVLRTALPAAVLRPGAREKTELYVEPLPLKDSAAASAAAPAPSAAPSASAAPGAKQDRKLWLRDQLERVGGGWMRQVEKEFKTTAATLRKMEAEGLVRIEPVARRRNPLANRRVVPSRPLALNDEQKAALEAISRAEKPILLQGVTGSGKTEVYLQAIARELERDRGAIVMVPEIALTPQTLQRFASRFGDKVAVLHSALSDGERYDEWHRIRSGEARVVVGPRSAVFAPVRNLGLIVVDEEHEATYKQDSTPRYHARDVAVLRAQIEGAKVVLGSATPSLESYHNAEKGKYSLVTMAHRAGHGSLPLVNIVDMGESQGGAMFSRQLLDAIHRRLDRGEQTILFLNRRGYSRALECDSCGAAVMCPNCSMAYTYHRAGECLRCHVCGSWAPIPEKCPECGSKTLSCKGIGTQRVEAMLGKCFPRAKILRMDADSTSRKNSHDDILGAFRRGEAQILLGTQMIAKGLDFPNVTLVGVLNADSSLNMPDFRAAERTYQLIAQVSGRAGRSELPGEVFIQTYSPRQSVIVAAARGDFAAFAREELAERKSCYFPPFCRLAVLNLASRDEALVTGWAELYAKSLALYAAQNPALNVSEAVPSALEKADGLYRWQIVLRAAAAATISAAWKWLSSQRPPPKDLRAIIDIDAFSVV